MTRFALASLLALSVLAPGPIAPRAAAQPPSLIEQDQHRGNALDDLAQLARAKYEASKTSLRDLARQRREAAREGYESAARIYEAGKGTQDALLEWTQWMAEAESAPPTPSADQVRELERRWEQLWLAEAITKGRLEAARASRTELMQARYARLTVQQMLAQARAGKGKK
jgi:hypothetical protein